MSCHAPNDRLIHKGLLTNAIEVYFCELELGHTGPHKCSGHPIWWDDSPPHSHSTVDVEDLSTRALKAMLPPDAAEVADRLVPMEQWARNEYDDMTDADTLARAIAILRGEL